MLGERIKENRKLKGLTQKDLAKMLNVTFQTISKYELGINVPDAENLKKLSTLFDCTVDYLLGKTDEPNYSVYRNEEFEISLQKSYPYELTPDEVEKVIKLLKEYRFDIDSLIQDIKSGKVT